MCEEFLSGRNCNLMVYGPTSTGKTHTMQGPLMEEGLSKINVKAMVRKAFEKEYGGTNKKKKTNELGEELKK